MNVLITPDCEGWAIDNLTDAIIRHNPQINFYKLYIHPRAVGSQLFMLKNLLKDVKIDLWHAQYWNSAQQMLDICPELSEIPSILTHHNHDSLEKGDWGAYDALVTPTNWGVKKLGEKYNNVTHIPYGIDLERFSFIEEYKAQKTIGYIGRIVPWKNLGKICDVAQKLGYRVIGSGYIDKPNYWKTINKEILEFNGGIGRESRKTAYFKDNLYEKMTIFCMYSTGERETGTLPMFEAMARGIPVLVTEQGSARDLIIDGENGIVFNDENFEEKLKLIMEDEGLRLKLRENAWQTVKNYSEQKMARSYARLYNKIAYDNQKMISIIIPTFNRADTLLETLLSIETNPYKAKEIIVCDDGSSDHTFKVVQSCKEKFTTSIKYISTGIRQEYGLAKARNIGVIESIGDILFFLDDRYILREDTLQKIIGNCLQETWNFGNKVQNGIAADKKNFVENCSWMYRDDFIKGGMFSERITMYGGISQEARTRYSKQGYGFNFVPSMQVDVSQRTKKYKKKDEVWKAKLLISKMYE